MSEIQTLIKQFLTRLTFQTLLKSPALTSQGSQLIMNYDEHELNNTFKFGVIYQTFGQVSDTHFHPYNPYTQIQVSDLSIVTIVWI